MLWFLIVGMGAMFLAHTAPFPFLIEALAPSRSIWRMPRADGPPLVYLTYDDGPNPAATPELLDVLLEQQVHATFFLIDEHVTEDTAPIVRRMFEEGHAVALHAGSRAPMFKSRSDLAAMLARNAGRIEQLGGGRPCRLFRPHAGWRGGAMYEGLIGADYRLVGWSWGLWDWNWFRARRADELAARLRRRMSPGDIVVMHDGHHINPAADRRYAVEATRQLVPAIKARGFGFGVLCGEVSSSTSAAAGFGVRIWGSPSIKSI